MDFCLVYGMWHALSVCLETDAGVLGVWDEIQGIVVVESSYRSVLSPREMQNVYNARQDFI
jgi:hypothetical protein